MTGARSSSAERQRRCRQRNAFARRIMQDVEQRRAEIAAAAGG